MPMGEIVQDQVWPRPEFLFSALQCNVHIQPPLIKSRTRLGDGHSKRYLFLLPMDRSSLLFLFIFFFFFPEVRFFTLHYSFTPSTPYPNSLAFFTVDLKLPVSIS